MNEDMIMDEVYGVYTDTEFCCDETEESYVINPDEDRSPTDNNPNVTGASAVSDEDYGEAERIMINNQIELYMFLNEHTKSLVANADVFKDFTIRATLLDRSYNAFDISDSILIYSQKPDARYVYDEAQIQNFGLGLRRDAEPVYLLDGVNDAEEILDERSSKRRGKKSEKKTVTEPDTSDREIMEVLRVLKLYDISQINAYPPNETRIEFADKGAAAEGIVMVSPCELEYSNSAPSRKHACYDHSKNVITYTNGCKSYDSLFSDLVCEYAHFEIANMMATEFYRDEAEDSENRKYIYNRKSFLFHAECVSYIICKLYDMNPGIYDFAHLHQSWTEMTPVQLRLNLTRIITAALNIDTRIQNLLRSCLQYMNMPDETEVDSDGGDAYEG